MSRRKVEVCVSRLGLLESPRWARGAVWFSDWTAGDIHRYEVGSSSTETVAHLDSLPLCFDLSGSDFLVFDSRHGALLRTSTPSHLEQWVDVQNLSKGGGNEVLAAGDVTYLNFGNFDPRPGFPTEPVGVIAAVDSTGSTRILADKLAFPNGMAITNGGGELVVAESHAGRLTAWTIEDDGTLTGRRIWAEIDGAAPDGISMAPDGTCWYVDVPAQQVVHLAEGGGGRSSSASNSTAPRSPASSHPNSTPCSSQPLTGQAATACSTAPTPGTDNSSPSP